MNAAHKKRGHVLVCLQRERKRKRESGFVSISFVTDSGVGAELL